METAKGKAGLFRPAAIVWPGRVRLWLPRSLHFALSRCELLAAAFAVQRQEGEQEAVGCAFCVGRGGCGTGFRCHEPQTARRRQQHTAFSWLRRRRISHDSAHRAPSLPSPLARCQAAGLGDGHDQGGMGQRPRVAKHGGAAQGDAGGRRVEGAVLGGAASRSTSRRRGPRCQGMGCHSARRQADIVTRAPR